MARKKEYNPIGKYPVYDEAYNKYRMESRLLNSNANKPGVYFKIWDKDNLKFALDEIVGDETGQYWRNKQWFTAYKPFVLLKLAEIEARFKNYCNQFVRQGKPEPTFMPDHLANEKYKYEARLSVLDEEVAHIQKLLKTFEDEVAMVDESNLLKYGLLQSGRMGRKNKDGQEVSILVELDGQQIVEKEGILIIANGIYRGMAVSDYRELSNRWREERRQASNGLFVSRKKINKDSLPAWPKGVTNHLESQEEISR